MVGNGIFEPSTLSWPSVLYPYRQACFDMFWPTKICEFQDAEVQCMIWKGLVNGRPTNRIRPHLSHLILTPYGTGTRFNFYLASENWRFPEKNCGTLESLNLKSNHRKRHTKTVKAWEPDTSFLHFRPQKHPSGITLLNLVRQAITWLNSVSMWNCPSKSLNFDQVRQMTLVDETLEIPVKGLGSDCLLNLCCFNFR